MIELRQFPYAWGINPSPFCLKVESYLKLTGLPFTAVIGDYRKAPKGKLPVIVDQGRIIPDSGHILAYLKATYGDPLDARLSPGERALGHVVRRTCEESLFFVLNYSRWIDPDVWAVRKAALADRVPPLLRPLAPILVEGARRTTARNLHAQGYGRHSREEVYALGIADLEAIERLLPVDGFLFGSAPSTFDLSIHGLLANIVKPPVDAPLNTFARGRARLVGFVADMDAAIEAAVTSPCTPRPPAEAHR